MMKGAIMHASKAASKSAVPTGASISVPGRQPARLSAQHDGAVAQALALQRTVGNRATQRLLGKAADGSGASAGCAGKTCDAASSDTLETAAHASEPGEKSDSLPREATTPARHSTSSASIANYEDEANRVAAHVFANRSFQRERANVAEAPGRTAPKGEPVPGDLRHTMEELLGRDFSSVRLRGASPSEKAAAPKGTLAATTGSSISFFSGSYRPDLPLGQALIAHELTHVAQQGAAPPLPGRGQALDDAYARDIRGFQSEYPGERLARAHAAIADTSGRYPISMAPSGMQQRCTGCDSCKPSSGGSGFAPSASSAPPAPVNPAPTAGTTARDRAKQLIDEKKVAKEAHDKLIEALNEIRAGKSLDFHRLKTPEVIKKGAAALGVDESGLLSDWEWFLASGPPDAKSRADDKAWTAHRGAFLQKIRSPLDRLEKGRERSQATYLLKNTPAGVFDLIIQVATPAIPPAYLYAVAGTEGLVDVYIRPQVSSPATPDALTESELAGVSMTKEVHGFNELGLDDFFTELENRRQPLRGFFPSGFDETKVTESRNTNEKGRVVRSANAPDLKTALQALVAVISRRQALFQEDRRALGFGDPTGDELVYFTYVYYNSGPGDPARGDGTPQENGGFQTLSRHRPAHPNTAARRGLGDWLRLKEYPNAIKVLQTYQVLVAGKVLKGY
jgi:hypothetical protein